MDIVLVNLLAVLVAAAAHMIIGMAWYSPALLGKQWMALSGMSPGKIEEAKKKGGMWKTYLASFVSALVMAYVLAHIVVYAGAVSVSEGLQSGFWMWLGFVATVSLTHVLYEKQPLKLYGINMGFHLAVLLVMGAILAIWQ